MQVTDLQDVTAIPPMSAAELCSTEEQTTPSSLLRCWLPREDTWERHYPILPRDEPVRCRAISTSEVT